MNRPTFWMIKYMNGSVFSKARHMNGVCFEILARTPVPQLPPRYLPPSPWPRDTRGSMFFSDRKSAVCIHSQSKKYFSSISQISPLSELPFFFVFFCFFFVLVFFRKSDQMRSCGIHTHSPKQRCWWSSWINASNQIRSVIPPFVANLLKLLFVFCCCSFFFFFFFFYICLSRDSISRDGHKITAEPRVISFSIGTPCVQVGLKCLVRIRNMCHFVAETFTPNAKR